MRTWATVLLLCWASLSLAQVNPPPSTHIDFDFQRQVVSIQVNLTFVPPSQTQNAYSLDFRPWTTLSSLYDPTECSNRRSSDFNHSSPLPWNDLWTAEKGVVGLQSSGAYPEPTKFWTVRTTDDNLTVIYDGLFVLDQFVRCGGADLTTTVSDLSIVYEGTFYVTWLRPRDPPSPSNEPLTGTYDMVLYKFPFSITINRQLSTLTQVPQISFISFSLQSIQVNSIGSGNNQEYYLSAVLSTLTPASYSYAGNQLLNYNDLVFAGVTSQPPDAPQLLLNHTASSVQCTLQLSSCFQLWTLYSLPIANASALNATYSLHFLINECNATDASHSQCTVVTLSATIPIGVSTSVPKVQSTTNVVQFGSHLEIFADATFQTRRSTNAYLPDQMVYVLQAADLGQISPNFFTLKPFGIWACVAVIGGRPPTLGYDPTLGIVRTGCSQPERINGQVNIPENNIVQLYPNSKLAQSVNITRPETLLQSQMGVVFNSDTLRGAKLVGDVMIEVSSVLTPSTIVQYAPIVFRTMHSVSPHVLSATSGAGSDVSVVASNSINLLDGGSSGGGSGGLGSNALAYIISLPVGSVLLAAGAGIAAGRMKPKAAATTDPSTHHHHRRVRHHKHKRKANTDGTVQNPESATAASTEPVQTNPPANTEDQQAKSDSTNTEETHADPNPPQSSTADQAEAPAPEPTSSAENQV